MGGIVLIIQQGCWSSSVCGASGVAQISNTSNLTVNKKKPELRLLPPLCTRSHQAVTSLQKVLLWFTLPAVPLIIISQLQKHNSSVKSNVNTAEQIQPEADKKPFIICWQNPLSPVHLLPRQRKDLFFFLRAAKMKWNFKKYHLKIWCLLFFKDVFQLKVSVDAFWLTNSLRLKSVITWHHYRSLCWGGDP